jgi:hypothetical protein
MRLLKLMIESGNCGCGICDQTDVHDKIECKTKRKQT